MVTVDMVTVRVKGMFEVKHWPVTMATACVCCVGVCWRIFIFCFSLGSELRRTAQFGLWNRTPCFTHHCVLKKEEVLIPDYYFVYSYHIIIYNVHGTIINFVTLLKLCHECAQLDKNRPETYWCLSLEKFQL